MKLNIAKYAGVVDNFVNNQAVPLAKRNVAKGLALTAAGLSKASDTLSKGSVVVASKAVGVAISAKVDEDILGIN